MRVLSQSTGSFLIERPITITWRLVNIVTIPALSGARCPILLFRPGKDSPGDRDTSKSLYEDLEKLPTLLKFEVVCLALGKKLDRGQNIYGRIKEVVQCRNEFVHPKPQLSPIGRENFSEDIGVNLKRTKSSRYPLTFEYVTAQHAKDAIGNMLEFLSWIVFDTCQIELEDGSMRLGCGSRITPGDVLLFAEEYGFDVRTFGSKGYDHH